MQQKITALTDIDKKQPHFSPLYFELNSISHTAYTSNILTFPYETTTTVRVLPLSLPQQTYLTKFSLEVRKSCSLIHVFPNQWYNIDCSTTAKKILTLKIKANLILAIDSLLWINAVCNYVFHYQRDEMYDLNFNFCC